MTQMPHREETIMLRDEIERLRAEVAKWVEQHGRDSAELRSLCESRDEARRNVVELHEDLQEARSALAALRKRVEEARVVNTVVEYANGEQMVWLEDDAMPPEFAGKRVALVVLGEG